MSVNVSAEVVPRGETDHVEAAWTLKERIRTAEGVLKQRRGFFTNAYRRSRVDLFLEDDDVIAFAAARSDGYILFLAVAPEHRGEGLGERLVGRVAETCDSVSCHARTTNEDALNFYEHVGFERVRRVDRYYEDGGDAYYLRLGEEPALLDRLSSLLRR
ncbi:MAG: GNAT family N-acetyltransferase [Halobacteriaceae archaeon]